MPTEMLVTLFTAVLASGGLWALLSNMISNRQSKNSNAAKVVLGIAHDRIIYLGMQYLKRGYITHDEFENLYDYIYIPYSKLGGNGSAKRVIEEVAKLPIRDRVLEEGTNVNEK